MNRIFTIVVLLAALAGCIANPDGFTMMTADPHLGIRFTFPEPPLASHDPQPLPGETGESEDPEILATPSCLSVKANVSKSGEKIYHVPGQANYNNVLIEESKGEAFYCTVEEAEAAGFRAALN